MGLDDTQSARWTSKVSHPAFESWAISLHPVRF